MRIRHTHRAKIKTLQTTVAKLQTKLTATRGLLGSFLGCMNEVPLSEYGDSAGSFGYVFDTGTGTVDTSALDVTATGDTIGAWFMVDACNTQTTAAKVRSPSGVGVRPSPLNPRAMNRRR